LRGIRYAKLTADFVPGDPDDTVVLVDDHRHEMASRSRHLAVDEQVLQALPAHAGQPNPVAGTAVPHI